MQPETNSSRQIIKIIREISEEEKLDMKVFSDDWIISLSNGEKHMYIYGYQFPSNDASAQLICTDKSALSSILRSEGILCVDHEYFMCPELSYYTGREGVWERLYAVLDKFGKVVVKKNRGTGGNDMFIVDNRQDMDRAAVKLFGICNSIAVCPYLEIEDEYRIIFCFGNAETVYRKIRRSVTGDGKKTVAVLITEKYGHCTDISEGLDLERIPEKGEKVIINWRHNLGHGATAEEIGKDCEEYPELVSLAKNAAEKLNIRFASIDIVKVGGKLMILEINSGIMMESFSKDPAGYKTAKRIYTKAIKDYFYKQ